MKRETEREKTHYEILEIHFDGIRTSIIGADCI